MKRPERIQSGGFVGRPYDSVSCWNPKTGEHWDYKDYAIRECKAFAGWYYIITFSNGDEFKSETFANLVDMHIDLISNKWRPTR